MHFLYSTMCQTQCGIKFCWYFIFNDLYLRIDDFVLYNFRSVRSFELKTGAICILNNNNKLLTLLYTLNLANFIVLFSLFSIYFRKEV